MHPNQNDHNNHVTFTSFYFYVLLLHVKLADHVIGMQLSYTSRKMLISFIQLSTIRAEILFWCVAGAVCKLSALQPQFSRFEQRLDIPFC